MRFSVVLSAGILAPIAVLAAPAGDVSASELALRREVPEALYKRENLCHLNAPPALCKPNSSVTVAETAQRAYQFYRAFVVDGDPAKMFSLIDSVYEQHNPAYRSGPQQIWPLFCAGRKIGTEASTSWCFDASTNMSYARYSVTDRWQWVDGCVHAHWDQGERMPSADKCYKLPTTP